jgi:hypothetical protein
MQVDCSALTESFYTMRIVKRGGISGDRPD